MIVSMLELKHADMAALRITDPYSIHRVVYDLFDDVRNDVQKATSTSSGIQYVDKGGDFNSRQILILSNRSPKQPRYGKLNTKVISDSFLQHDHYQFEVVVNPTKRDSKTGKLIAVRGHEEIAKWFMEKAIRSWGFSITEVTLQVDHIGVQRFYKTNDVIIQASARLYGQLKVMDRERFITSFKQGIGRGRAFGLGLLQIVPINISSYKE